MTFANYTYQIRHESSSIIILYIQISPPNSWNSNYESNKLKNELTKPTPLSFES